MSQTIVERPDLQPHLWELTDARSLDDMLWCLHCETTFPARDILARGSSLACPVKGCNGSPIDWHTYAWLRGQHADQPGADYYPERPEPYHTYALYPPESG